VDSITEQLSQLQELSDEQLSELENSALTEFEGTQKQDLTPQVVDTMEQLANAVEAVRTEKARRVSEMEELNTKAAEAASRISPPEDAAPDGTGSPEEQPEDLPADAPPISANDPAVEPNPPGDDEKLKPGEYSAEETADAELSTTTPVEETTEPEPTPEAAAAVEVAEETELSTEAPAEAEASTDEAATAEPEAVAEAAVEAPAEAEAAVEEVTTEAETAPAAEAAGESESTTVEVPAETENSTTETNPEAPVTAAAQGAEGSLQIEPPADRKLQIKPAATMTITAGADIPGTSAGTKLNDMYGVAEAFTKRLHTLRHVHGGDGEQHIVASLQFDFPEDRHLGTSDPQENTDKVFKVTSPEALTAAAGICLPLETRYDLGCDVGVTDRPVRDALARFGADRGGIRYFSAPVLTDSAAATGFWRGDSDGANWHTYGPDRTTATSPADAKPCLEVQCTAERTAYIEAITLCLTFNNLTTRTFPELVQRHNELALVAHARIAENALLAQIEAGSTAITAQTQIIGAAREIFNLLGRAVASYRFKHRMNSVSPLRMVAPMWVMDLLRADLAMQMPGDGLDDTLGVAEAKINTWFRARGVNITWHLDGVGPVVGDLDDGGAGTAVGFEWPTTIEFGLWAEGTWLYLDGGTLDLGVIRDSSLVATNQYKQFVETFEGVANMGCDSYWVTAAYAPSGQAASLVDTLS
jgi:hypothetical protein